MSVSRARANWCRVPRARSWGWGAGVGRSATTCGEWTRGLGRPLGRAGTRGSVDVTGNKSVIQRTMAAASVSVCSQLGAKRGDVSDRLMAGGDRACPSAQHRLRQEVEVPVISSARCEDPARVAADTERSGVGDTRAPSPMARSVFQEPTGSRGARPWRVEDRDVRAANRGMVCDRHRCDAVPVVPVGNGRRVKPPPATCRIRCIRHGRVRLYSHAASYGVPAPSHGNSGSVG